MYKNLVGICSTLCVAKGGICLRIDFVDRLATGR